MMISKGFKTVLTHVFIIVFIILFDQITKRLIQSKLFLGQNISIIDNFFNITYARNAGVAFGMGAEAHFFFKKIFFIAVPIVACIWLFYLIYSSREKPFRLGLAYALIFAGAIGNLIDRMYFSYVVDFFDFYYGQHHFATFNIADSAITLAAFLLIYDFFVELKKNRK